MQAAQMQAMLDLKHCMNMKVDPLWIDKPSRWYRFAWLELGELAEEFGYKDWELNKVNLTKIQQELTDVWAFGLSMIIEEGMRDHRFKRDVESNWDEIEPKFSDHLETHYGEIIANVSDKHEKILRIGMVSVVEGDEFLCLVERFVEDLIKSKRFKIRLFRDILYSVGMNWDDLYIQFIAKNVLTNFRFDHGGMDGTYQKQWDGLDDTEYLPGIMDSLDMSNPNAHAEVYTQLDGLYQRLVLSRN